MSKKLFVQLAMCVLMHTCYADVQTNCNLFSVDDNSGLKSIQPSLAGFNEQILSKVDQQIKQDISNGFPGVGLIIIKDGRVIKQSVYGYSLEYSAPLQNKLKQPTLLKCNTLFDLASNTKMYATNYAVMHLVSNGYLDLNQPIKHYIPEYSGCDVSGQCRDDRLVKDLLSHNAGYMADPQFFNPISIKKYGLNLYSQNRQLTESLIVNQLPFIKSRGGSPVYSDVDFMLLGILIERISGMNLDDYVSENIYHPLKLNNTIFNPLEHGFTESSCAATEIMGNSRGGSVHFPNIRQTTLQCQVHDEKAWYSMGGVSGHAGLFSNLHDMAVLTELALNNGQYLNTKIWDTNTEAQFIKANRFDDSYGFGWRLAGNHNRYSPFGHYASSSAFGHTGWTGTVTLIDPKYNLIIILLTNKKHTPFINNKFLGDDYSTGKYYPIIDLIYQSFLLNN